MTRVPGSSFVFRWLLSIAACVLLAPSRAAAQTSVNGGWPETGKATPVTRAAKASAGRARAGATAVEPAADRGALQSLVRRQTELLEQIATELEAQRAIVMEQQQRIAALETPAGLRVDFIEKTFVSVLPSRRVVIGNRQHTW